MKITNVKMWSSVACIALSAVLSAETAFAAGYEKNLMWGGHEAGVAGIAAPWVQGADALYYNPAGLAKDKTGQDISLQLSPTFVTAKAPIDYQNNQVTSDQSTTVPGGLLYDWTMDSQFGWGVGYYASAGDKLYFNNVPFATGINPNALGNAFTDIAVTEFSLGAGYKLNDQWKVGIAWRAIMANAGFQIINPNPQSPANSIVDLSVNSAKATNFYGFRLGAQYKPAEKTLIGLTYRSEANLDAAGTFGGYVTGSGANTQIDSTGATVHTVLPMQVALAAQQEYEKWRALAQYDWTQYSRVNEVGIDGVVTAGNGAQTLASGAHVAMRWQDQHTVRLGGEYIGFSWPIRFGYIWSSAVTDPNFAKPALFPPGSTNVLTLGTGTSWALLGNPLALDAGLEYGMVSGSGNGAPAGSPADSTGNTTRSGTYTAAGYSLHLGAQYSF